MPPTGPGLVSPAVNQLPEAFREALKDLRRAALRPEAQVTEVPAPTRLAPFGVALRAEVSAPTIHGHQVPKLRPVEAAGTEATGRFILLHDPAGQDAWGGDFRVVIYIRAQLDPEMSDDPLLASVAWTWLVDALNHHGVRHSAAGGTATRILSESFGSLETKASANDVELRASWTPTGGDFGTHLQAWADMVCCFAGVPDLPDGVIALPHFRRT